MRTYIDVGANDGRWGLERAQHAHCRVFAFEPTPELIRGIVGQYPPSNYTLVPKAVSDVPGKATFHISPQLDWGCSSLLEFKPQEVIEKVWPGRPDIKNAYDIEVDCVRMDDFCRENGITEVEFIHIDAQGMDLRVMQSFGDLISIVRAGELETATAVDRAIYSNQDATLPVVTEWLTSKGFRIVSVTSNDPQTNEVNVVFGR